MSEDQESDVGLIKNSKSAEAILDILRSKVPPLIDFHDVSDRRSQEIYSAIQSKIDNLLDGYPEDAQKRTISNLVTETITAGCLSYEIAPVELILIPKVLDGTQIAMVDTSKKIGPVTIKNFFIDPSELMFRVQLLSRHGLESSKNITDMVFVVMHEMTHLGQSNYADDETKDSKKFDYANRPTEIHADEVALSYCRNLVVQVQGKLAKNEGDKVLLRGLPETIRQAEEYRRPLM